MCQPITGQNLFLNILGGEVSSWFSIWFPNEALLWACLYDPFEFYALCITFGINSDRYIPGIAISAFDSLIHEILLSKMSHFGIGVNVFSWFQPYLNDRLISVDPLLRIHSHVNFGVSQGSVLGSLLFLIYVNDLFDAVKKQKPIHCCRLCHLKSSLAHSANYSSPAIDSIKYERFSWENNFMALC